MSSNIKNILNLINKTVIDNYSINVWIPSLLLFDTPYVSFKPINISQQKDLLSTAAIQDIYNTTFIKTMFNILKENYLSEGVLPLNNLNIIDKIIIILSLRANINPIFNNININEIISKIQKHDMTVFAAQSIESDNIKLICKIPTIYTEFLCESERETLNTEDVNEQIQHVVSETIVNELTKFCSELQIGEEDILLDTYSFTERKQIINQLPAFLLEKALNYIISYRKHIEYLLSLNKANEVAEILQLNGVFFSTV